MNGGNDMIRKIIKIDKEQCNGCGLCADACHEGAIGMVNGKATLLRDDYCDGLGDCLPVCPTGAISFEERRALPYDEAAVKKNQLQAKPAAPSCGCPGTQAKPFHRDKRVPLKQDMRAESALRQWPVQIQLAPINAPYFEGASLLIAADCCAYAYAAFHKDFIDEHITLIGCPKLDLCDYTEKLTEILSNNNCESVTVARMEVPCCGGIEQAVRTAAASSGKDIALRVVTITTDGNIL